MPAPVIILAAAAIGGAEIIGTAIIESVIEDAVVSSTVATAVGAGAISAAVSAASGGDANDVLTAAVTGAITSGVGQTVGEAVGGGVTGGTVGSMAATAVGGGSGDDIIRNAVAGGAGTYISNNYGPEVGNAAKTYIATGSAEQAAVSAAASSIQQDAKTNKNVAEIPSGTQVAQADTGVISDTPYQVGIAGAPIFAESSNASSVNVPQGTRLMSSKEADDRPLGSYYDPNLNAWLVTENIFSGDTPGAGSGSTKSPGFLTSGPSDYTSVVGRGGSAGPTASVSAPRTNFSDVTVTGSRIPDFGEINVTDKKDTTVPDFGEIQITDTRESNISPYEKTTTNNDSSRFLTSSSISPKKSLTTLPKSLQLLSSQSTPVATTGLTSYRPAGEIESEETGKERQDVWNEASLRLKDALGL